MHKLATSAERIKRLVGLVRSEIETNPFEYDGHLWAAKPQAEICRELGVSAPTLRKMVKDHPKIQPNRIKDKQRGPMKLLRLGDPAPVTPYAQAQHMSKDWARKLKELRTHPKHSDDKRPSYTTNAEFKRMLKLAGKWPADKAPELFRIVIDNWGAFMAGAKARHAEHEAQSPADLEGLRFHHLPNIALICKYSDVALEMAAFPNAHEVPDIGLKAAA